MPGMYLAHLDCIRLLAQFGLVVGLQSKTSQRLVKLSVIARRA